MSDNITLPRSVVEHVMYHLNRGDADAVCWADGVIKPALEQPQRKLTPQDIADSALLGNIESPFNACMHQEHCKRWKEQAEQQPPTTEESSAVQQPQGEQEPMARVVGTGHLGGHFDWCKPGLESPDLPSGTPLYIHPQPKREPLTDMQKLMCWSRATHDADVEHKTQHQCLMDYGAEIEAAHNIGSKA